MVMLMLSQIQYVNIQLDIHVYPVTVHAILMTLADAVFSTTSCSGVLATLPLPT